MGKLSLAVASLVLGISLQADSTTLASAFKNGKVGGDLDFYLENVDNSGGNKDSGFTVGSVGISYETDSYKGFKANIAFRANHNFSEVEDGDYGSDTNALMTIANISYENDMFALILGRQAIDLEWIGDIHEAYVGVFKGIPDTTIVVGHTVRWTPDHDFDGPLNKYSKIGDKGASVVDAKYAGLANTILNGYYYDYPDTASWYGAKITYDTNIYGFTAGYATSDEKVNSVSDGSIAQLEVRGNFQGLGVNVGYITTDKQGGVGSMASIGDNINPFEDGNHVYDADAQTTYGGLSYEMGKVSFSTLYGVTEYGSDEEKELNLGAEYDVNDALDAEILWVNVDAQNSADDYNKVELSANYSF